MNINSDLIIGDTGKTLKDVCYEDTYSTNEVKTNKVYIDANGIKRSIYRYVYRGQTPGINLGAWQDIGGTPSGFYKLFSLGGTFTNDSGNKMSMGSFTVGGNTYGIELRVSNYNSMQISQLGWTGKLPYEIILEYIKN